ncbi:MAG TPA: YdeI/OmpD-associated family protein [Saprospiraceae bacterium]|nr:YdeI/OmpD-associated family protein [Saprospiraceae bacterium]
MEIVFTGVMKMGTGVYHYGFIEIPVEVQNQLQLKHRDRLVVSFPGGGHIHCAAQRYQDGPLTIYLGKHFRKQAGIQPGIPVRIQICRDNSEYGMAVPEELEEVFATDPEGLQAFLELTPGKKRSALYFVSKAKMQETRIQRALLVVENIKLGFTQPNQLVRKNF